MVYLGFLLLTTLYYKQIKIDKYIPYKKLLIFSLPIIFLWCLIIGGQYNVGTDYPTYLEMFKSGNLGFIEGNRNEILFVNLVKYSNNIGLYGQSIFFILSLISILILIYIIDKSVTGKYIFLFWLVFICFPGTFNNQMNTLRQYLAIYILTLSVILFLKKKYFISILLFSLIGFIHSSAWVLIPLFFLIFCIRNKISYGILVMSVLVGFLLSFILDGKILSYIIPYFEVYKNYFSDDIIENSLIVRFTKYLYIPLFIYSINKFKKFKLYRLNYYLFIFGVFGFVLKLSFMSLPVFSRIGLYFEILSCIPLVYLLIYQYKRKLLYSYLITLIIIIIPYLLKITIFARGEYLYDNFLFY